MKTIVKILWLIFITCIATMAALMAVSTLTGCKTTKHVNREAVTVESKTEKEVKKDSTGQTEIDWSRFVESQTTVTETIDTTVTVTVPIGDSWVTVDVPVKKHRKTEKQEYAQESQKTTQQSEVTSSEKQKEEKSSELQSIGKDVERSQFPWWIIAPLLVILVVLIVTRKIWIRLIKSKL